MHPTESLWVDIVIPRDDELWSDDIGRSMWWLGEEWSVSLGAVGVSGLVVHRGGMISNDLSKVLCFAGLGPGEVAQNGTDGSSPKVVGISQRRNREMARFQCVLYRGWNATLHSRMLPRLGGDVERIAACASPVGDLDRFTLCGETITWPGR